MTSPTQRTNAEEARKELLATIHASRELGPEMDDALTDRFMEQLATLRPANSFDTAATRGKFAALLQSARGSDPQADGALADSFLANLHPPRLDPQPYAYGGVPAPMEYGPLVRYRGDAFAQVAPLILCAAVLIVALWVSQGQLWWLVFFVPAIFGIGRNGRQRQQRRLQREQWRSQRNDRILNRDDINNPRLPPRRPPEII
ncbi:MAG TPA: hypothetical protein VFX31_13455 [Ktedonobacterales bacterium]|nr:hypothetical protein [Ktedonobacterales bacterium]HEX5572394.1 hypothetical protein [Ktedonobacterales bacterium]